MYQSFGITSSQSLSVRNPKFLQFQATSLRNLNALKFSTQYAAGRRKQFLTQPENVFIDRGDRFKLLHNTQLWLGTTSLGPLIEIENINETIKRQTENKKENDRKIQDIKETKINDLHIPKYVRLKLKAKKQFKPKRILKKRNIRATPENELRLNRKRAEEFMNEYYLSDKMYDMNLNNDLNEIRQEFRKQIKKTTPKTIAKILHPHGQQKPWIKQNTNNKPITEILTFDRNAQNSILNKIFYHTNDEQLKTNKFTDKFKPLLFTNNEIILDKPVFKLNYTLDPSSLSQSAAQKIRAMINPYGTDSLRRLRIFNNNHFTYIYDKHLFNDIVETPLKIAYIRPKNPDKRLQISEINASKKERIFEYIKSQNLLNIPRKSIHIQVKLLPTVASSGEFVETSNELNVQNIFKNLKRFVGNILKKKQWNFNKWLKKNKYIDRILSFLGLRRSRYMYLYPRLTNSDLLILGRKKRHNRSNSVCHLDNVHPTGIINTRNDYVTYPSLDELVSYVDNQTCIVDNFVIERIGYGKIEFMEPIDVYNLNIDKYVQLGRKNIDIYPNDLDKPPIGEGLNKKAKVTLHQVWPLDKYTNDLITDENHLESLHFKTWLESICVERNFKFVSYCVRDGCWVFNVDHF